MFCFGHLQSVHGVTLWLTETTTKGSNPNRQLQISCLGIPDGLAAISYLYPRTCKSMTAALKDLTLKAAHRLVVKISSFCVVLAKGEKALVLEIDASVNKQVEILEIAGRESRNYFSLTSLSCGKIRELEMCVSECIQKVSVSGQAFCSWCHETIRYGSTVCVIGFCFFLFLFFFGFFFLGGGVCLFVCLF